MKRIPLKPQIALLARKLMEAVQDYVPGEVIPWELMEQVTKLKRHSCEMWRSVRMKFQRLLQDERGLTVLPVVNRGLRIQPPAEHVFNVFDYRVTRALGHIRMGHEQISCLRDETCEDDLVECKYRTLGLLESHASSLRQDRDTVRTLSRKHQPPPL